MARNQFEPNLVKVNCVGLVVNASFRLGKGALAEYAKVKPRELVKNGLSFAGTYSLEKQMVVFDAELRLNQVFEGDAAERWMLTIRFLQTQEKPKLASSKHGSFQRFMKKLGKAGLDTDTSITAIFLRTGELPFSPALPVKQPMGGNAFTHIIGITMARLSDLGELLYEATLRKTDPRQPAGINIAFSYRTTLGEGLFSDVLRRATDLVDVILPAQGLQKTPGPTEPQSVKEQDRAQP